MPHLPLSWLGLMGVYFVLATILFLIMVRIVHPHSAAVSPPFAGLPIVTAASGIALIYFDGRRFPADCQTLGELAHKVAVLNFGVLAAAGAGRRDKDVWDTLLEVLSIYSRLPRSAISEDTLLLQSELHTASDD